MAVLIGNITKKDLEMGVFIYLLLLLLLLLFFFFGGGALIGGQLNKIIMVNLHTCQLG